MTARPFRHIHLPRSRAVSAVALLAVVAAALVAAAAVAAAPARAATSDDYFFVSSIGPTYGTNGAHTFGTSSPDGICVDANGNVYVTLPSGFAKFTAAGSLLCNYTGETGWYTPSVGGYGIDVDGNGRVYYADSNAHRIVKLSPYGGGLNGNIYNMVNMYGKGDGLGGSGNGAGEFDFPRDVAVDGNYLYVADKNNNRIQKFGIDSNDNTVTWLASWGKNGGDGTGGSGNGEFWGPVGIAADHQGRLFVADGGNSRVQVLTTAGAFVTAFGVSSPASSPFYFSDLNGIDVDAGDNVYTVETGNHRVKKFSPSGVNTWQLATAFGSLGSGDSQFHFPWNVAVAPNGYLYVTDTQNQKLKKFARDATPPTVSPAGFPAGWTKTFGHSELIASDPAVAGQFTSGGVSIWYSKTGGAPWTEYVEPFTSFDLVEGDNAFTYYAKDAVGNQSTPATVHVYYDKTAPVTTVSGIPAGWSKTPLTAVFSPQDAASGPASTAYSTDGGATWTPGLSAPLTAQGVSTLLVRSTDVAGNVETAQTVTARIDSARPVPKALKNKAVRHGKTVMLPFSVTDVTPQAKVTIKIYKGKALKKTLAVGTRATGAGLAYAYKCKLAKGKYTWKVYATDLAGNAQAKPGVKTLTVT